MIKLLSEVSMDIHEISEYKSEYKVISDRPYLHGDLFVGNDIRLEDDNIIPHHCGKKFLQIQFESLFTIANNL